MEIADTLIALIPLILVVALLVHAARGVTEGRGFKAVRETVPAAIVLLVAVLVVVAMGNAAFPVYVYDEDSGELVIQKNVPELDVQPWDSFASDVKSLVIEDGVTSIGAGAFDTLTGLEYVSISDRVESITSSAFGVTLKDCFGQTIADPEAGEYVGTGDGTLYYCDTSIYTYSTDRKAITGLTTEASAATVLALPSEHDGTTITTIGTNAFKEKGIATVYSSPKSELATVAQYSFQGCTSLTTVTLPDTVSSIGDYAFQGDLSLSSLDIPASLTSFGRFALRGTSITSVLLPEGFQVIGAQCFRDCSMITSVYFPSSIETLGQNAFLSCAGITSVTFAAGYDATIESGAFGSWTFYDSDGTTELDKTDATALAGFTFQGTASALVKVLPGQLSLTPDQIQQVWLNTQELQDLNDQITFDPLPFQPTVQTQDQEPVSA